MGRKKLGSFIAFTAMFAVLAIIVFWGTWALDKVPVMPDAQTSFSVDHAGDFICKWRESGKAVPGDILNFIGSPYLWVEMQYVFALYFAALGMAYFLRGRGLGRFAAYSAGLFLAFSGYWITLFSAGHLGWFQWMTYGVFAFALVDRVILKGRLRHLILFGALLAWGSFYQPDLWLLFTAFTGVYFIYRSILDWPGFRRWVLRCVVALVVFVAIGLPSFISAITKDLAGREKQIASGETVSASVSSDAEKRWIFTTNWSMPPEDTLEFYRSRIHGDTSCEMTLALSRLNGSDIKPYTGRLGRPYGAQSGNYRQHSLYVGATTCCFALIGLLMALNGPRRRDVLFFAVAAVVFWLFSMGRYCEPVYRIVYALPFGDYLRAPVKWHHLTEFSIVVLSAFGLEAAWRIIAEKRVLWARAVLLCLVAAAVVELAAQAKIYCAPHTADMVAGVLPQPIPSDFAEALHFRRQISQAGLKIAGETKKTFRLPDGSVRELPVLVVEQRVKRPEPRKIEDIAPLKGGVYFAAILSLFATLCVSVFAAVSASLKKVDGVRL